MPTRAPAPDTIATDSTDAAVAERLLQVAQLLEVTNGLLRDVASRLQPSAVRAPAPARPRARRSTRKQVGTASAEAAATQAPKIKRGPRRRRGAGPGLHEEITAILRDAGEPLSAGDIAQRINARGRYKPRSRTGPTEGQHVSARVNHPDYKALFGRAGRRITLAAG